MMFNLVMLSVKRLYMKFTTEKEQFKSQNSKLKRIMKTEPFRSW